MRNIVRNLLLLIAVCTVFLLLTRSAESFAAKKPTTKKTKIPPYLPYEYSDKNYYCVPQSITDTQFIPYFKSSFKTDQGWSITNGGTQGFFDNIKEYYCVAPNPIHYKRKDTAGRKNLLDALQKERPIGHHGQYSNISGISTTDCAKFYKPQKKRGMIAEIPCFKMTFTG
jgi:hypothetical protein